jgi:hypothetical protein
MRRWEDNIRMNFKEIGVNRRNLIDSAHDMNYCGALANTVLDLRVP